jgi:hypothetical protein
VVVFNADGSWTFELQDNGGGSGTFPYKVTGAPSAKGVLAVAWAADFSAEDAVQLQQKVARVTPDAVIKPRAGGGFDSTEAELEWQLEMFKDISEGKASPIS